MCRARDLKRVLGLGKGPVAVIGNGLYNNTFGWIIYLENESGSTVFFCYFSHNRNKRDKEGSGVFTVLTVTGEIPVN